MNVNQNTNIFVHKDTFRNVVCKSVATIFRPQIVNIVYICGDVMRSVGFIKIKKIAITSKLILFIKPLGDT